MENSVKLTKAQINRAKVIRGEMTKVRCWLTGFEVGTGKTPPGVDSLRQAIILFDEIAALAAAEGEPT